MKRNYYQLAYQPSSWQQFKTVLLDVFTPHQTIVAIQDGETLGYIAKKAAVDSLQFGLTFAAGVGAVGRTGLITMRALSSEAALLAAEDGMITLLKRTVVSIGRNHAGEFVKMGADIVKAAAEDLFWPLRGIWHLSRGSAELVGGGIRQLSERFMQSNPRLAQKLANAPSAIAHTIGNGKWRLSGAKIELEQTSLVQAVTEDGRHQFLEPIGTKHYRAVNAETLIPEGPLLVLNQQNKLDSSFSAILQHHALKEEDAILINQIKSQPENKNHLFEVEHRFYAHVEIDEKNYGYVEVIPDPPLGKEKSWRLVDPKVTVSLLPSIAWDEKLGKWRPTERLRLIGGGRRPGSSRQSFSSAQAGPSRQSFSSAQASSSRQFQDTADYSTVEGRQEVWNQLVANSRKDKSTTRFLKQTTNFLTDTADLEEARQYFDKLKVYADPNVFHYNVLIKQCKEDGQIKEARAILEEMKTAGIEPSRVTFHSLISVCITDGKVEDALEIAQEMVAKGFELDLSNYNALIAVCIKNGNLEQALKFYKQLEDVHKLSKGRNATGKGYTKGVAAPDRYTFAALISVCIPDGNVAQALEFYRDMERKGITPDRTIFNALISVYANVKDGTLKEPLELFQKMKESGDPMMAPSHYTYHTLIAMYGRHGNPQGALELFKEMQDAGLAPERFTYHALISVYANAKGGNKEEIRKEAIKYFNEIKARGFEHNRISYNSLISVYAPEGNLTEAMKVFESMKTKGKKGNKAMNPDRNTYHALISVCIKDGKLEDALRFWQEMKEKGFEPNRSDFNALIAVYANSTDGNLGEALEYLREMRDKHIKPDFIIYSSLFSMASNYKNDEHINSLLQSVVNDHVFKESLGYDANTNTLNFHANSVYTKQIDYEHEPCVTEHVAKALLYNAKQKGNIKSETKLIVGQHGQDTIRKAVEQYLEKINMGYIYGKTREGLSNMGTIIVKNKGE